jgi:hypothetical protein
MLSLGIDQPERKIQEIFAGDADWEDEESRNFGKTEKMDSIWRLRYVDVSRA